MTEEQVLRLFKCLSDKSRLRILRSLSKEDMYVERLAQRLDLSPATISFHLKKLEEAGAVVSHREQYYIVYSFCPEIFQHTLLEMVQTDSPQESEQEQREADYRKKVIASFMEYGKLKSIPAQKKKERILLEEIAKVFKAGRNYTEKEVNLLIADFYDDFCTLRKDMVAEKLLVRKDGIYRKV